MKYYCTFFFLLLTIFLQAQTLKGKVTNANGVELSYATIEVKGINTGTTANQAGRYSLEMSPGKYTISCQHIGYQLQQKEIELTNGVSVLDFVMQQQQLTLAEVVVKQGEDPAYEIIRKAIKKRPALKNELKSFTTEVYTKGQLKLRDFPNKFFGQKVDFEDGDTGKRKFIFLSETISRYSVSAPDRYKVEVLASKVSGQSEGYGLSAPEIISFYDNNIKIGENLNPRGFISPVADNALNFYRYKYEGAFFEEGRQISRIRVTPKRKFEPTFSGYINIVEDEWRIHSLQLNLYKNSGLDLLDTLKLEQLYVPAQNGLWLVKSQVIYPAIKFFGFDAFGSFVNVYDRYDLNPSFEKGFFNNTIFKYTDSAQAKPLDYWNSNRPFVLETEEMADYRKKDSLEKLRQSDAYKDSIDRKRNKLTVSKLLLTGINFSRQKSNSNINIAPLTETISYNTVEGLVINARASFQKKLDSTANSRHSLTITPEVRYGFGNQHWNPNLNLNYRFGKKHSSSITVEGGSDVFQFNNAAPVGVLGSSFAALFSGRNNFKIYEARFGAIDFWKELGNGFKVFANSHYQDRIPLENTTDFSFNKKKKEFTPNYPLPQFDYNISRHQAVVAGVGLQWQPGVRYIEFPNQIVSLGSKWPTFSLNFIGGLPNIFSSDVDYSKWIFRIKDALNFQLLGETDYELSAGGFINKKQVAIPDLNHYKGNMSSLIAGSYLDRFQLIPHYYFSNSSSFYSAIFFEHHFNGFLTNKIPGIKQLKWNLVAGANGLFIDPNTNYLEPFIGLENVLKVLRVDYIWALEKNRPVRSEIRIGVKSTFLINR